MERLMDFAARNGPLARPPGQQPIHTPGLRLENALAFPTPAPAQDEHQQLNLFIEFGTAGAALAASIPALAGR